MKSIPGHEIPINQRVLDAMIRAAQSNQASNIFNQYNNRNNKVTTNAFGSLDEDIIGENYYNNSGLLIGNMQNYQTNPYAFLEI